MEAWRKAWREGVAPQLTIDELRFLHHGICSKDRRLINGVTAIYDTDYRRRDAPCGGACLLGYVEFHRNADATADDVCETFNDVVATANERLGDGDNIQYLIDFWDDDDNAERQKLMAHEVIRSIRERVRAVMH